jgi:hypothetical protein
MSRNMAAVLIKGLHAGASPATPTTPILHLTYFVLSFCNILLDEGYFVFDGFLKLWLRTHLPKVMDFIYG